MQRQMLHAFVINTPWSAGSVGFTDGSPIPPPSAKPNLLPGVVINSSSYNIKHHLYSQKKQIKFQHTFKPGGGVSCLTKSSNGSGADWIVLMAFSCVASVISTPLTWAITLNDPPLKINIYLITAKILSPHLIRPHFSATPPGTT